MGAWVGAHSLYASTIAKRVCAFEPDPVAFAILEQNAKDKPIEIYQEAIAEHAGKVTIGSGYLGASTTRKNLVAGGGIGAAVAEHTVTVPSTTIRAFAIVDSPLFMKIDIEGMEEEVFKDWRFFHEHKPSVLVEFHPWWWENEAETRKNFERIREAYKTAQEVHHDLYFLEN